MSFLNTLRLWDEAVACVEKRDPPSALDLFISIQEKNSKIDFNIGCLHLNSLQLDQAEKAFDGSIGRDQHLAVAFFQRGVTFYRKEMFEESLLDFEMAFKQLRGNQLIDYKALGLRYKLYACEVLHNVGLVQAQLGDWEKAQESLLSAISLRAEDKFSHVDRALNQILKQKLFPLVEIPAGLLFKPNKQYVAELEKKNYLGKAKVVSSVVPADEFSGFAPLQPQVDDTPLTPHGPEVLRVFEGEAHTVLYQFVPETKEELAVLPGNIVFVLQKGADQWASVVFNEKRGLVPSNFLQPLDFMKTPQTLQLDSVTDSEIPAPPRRPPPSRPLPPQRLGEQVQTSGQFSGCIVKVRFRFTVALHVAPGQPYGVLLQMISSKLMLPASRLTLRYAKDNGSERVIIKDSEMESVWRSMKNNRLTLWCSEEEREAPEEVLALYSYQASTPEDLSFSEGSVITVLTKVNEEWLEGQCGGHSGIFPSSFVKPLRDVSSNRKHLLRHESTADK